VIDKETDPFDGERQTRRVAGKIRTDKEIVLIRNNIVKNGEENHENCNRLSLGDG
jgi:hypothetical protein